MGKFNNRLSLIILAVVGGVLLLITLIFNSLGASLDVKASISRTTLFVGEDFTYKDSTNKGATWLWEFGNGASSNSREGKYRYSQSGNYKIRLRVNSHFEKIFNIIVQDKEQDQISRLVSIDAPKSAMQGELIVFRGIGNDKQWLWEFGESGIVDAREKDAIYTYSAPGIYEVRLYTENTKYPVSHIIEVYPRYSENDTTDIVSVISADIREKLQNISDRKSFNSNYNYIVNNYLGGNERTEVVVNNTKYNDIYSYCQGLRMAVKGSVTIDQVIAEIADLETGIVNKIMVIQTDR